MANSKTLVDTIPSLNPRYNAIEEYEVVIDTTDTNLTIDTPAEGFRLFVVGILLSEGTALDLTFTSGDDAKVQTVELAANQGYSGLTADGFYFVTKEGEALKLKASASIGAASGKNLILRVVEAKQL